MAQILIIDDNIDLLKVLREALEIDGHSVTTVSDGETGLALVDGGSLPGAILCDITLPHMNGLDLLRRLRAKPTLAKVMIIAMSGNAQLRAQALDAGANYYLEKPFHFPILFELLTQEESRKD